MTAHFLGTTDDVTTCECCGRSDLKSTVALVLTEDPTLGEPVYFGVVCAAKALKLSARDVRKAARTADDAKAEAERVAREKAAREADARWQAHLDARAPQLRGRRFEQIQALGGFTAASEGFERRADLHTPAA